MTSPDLIGLSMLLNDSKDVYSQLNGTGRGAPLISHGETYLPSM